MEKIINEIKEMITLMGFNDDKVELSVDEEHRKIMVKIDDESIREKVTSQVMSALDIIINQILRKHDLPHHVIDLNYYRKERERLITELARAAVKKATITKEDVELPSMNSYERRIVHMEISAHPEMETESIGEGKERRVVIKHIKE
jgi:spoIIIJ-associated protein